MERALGPVLRDARMAGLASPVFEDYDYRGVPDRLWVLFGAADVPSMVGVSIGLDDNPAEQIVATAMWVCPAAGTAVSAIGSLR
jgi:hypothetical protein